jgi:HK97 gp10 family phage protein
MNVGLTIDKKELAEIARNLESLNMSDSKNKTLLRQAMRKAAKPILTELKGLVPKDSGQLRKSLAVINGKNRRGVAPSVYVGPRVKGAFADKNKTGFYFYFLEYGFRGVAGLRMLDKSARSKGSQALNDVTNQLKKLIEKRFKK